MRCDSKNAKNNLSFLNKEQKNECLMCKKCTSEVLSAVCALKKQCFRCEPLRKMLHTSGSHWR